MILTNRHYHHNQPEYLKINRNNTLEIQSIQSFYYKIFSHGQQIQCHRRHQQEI